MLNEIADTLQALKLSYSIYVKEYLNIPEENVIYEIPKKDHIIEELIYLFRDTDKENLDIEDMEEMENNYELSVISISTAISSLETLHIFLLQ